MTCSRCGIDTPRLTLSQTRCPKCQGEVEATIRKDMERRGRARWAHAKDLTGAIR